MVPYQIPFFIVVATCLTRLSAIMVPTGKVGGITPPKPVVPVAPPSPTQYQAPAPVWERIDEGNNPYKPPVYKYILWDFVQKYGHHTLIVSEEDYYHPQIRVQPVHHFFYKSNKSPVYGKESSHTSFSKNKLYYSPLQHL